MTSAPDILLQIFIDGLIVAFRRKHNREPNDTELSLVRQACHREVAILRRQPKPANCFDVSRN
jgi:hypothetical protein